jgi:hypothetical protein
MMRMTVTTVNVLKSLHEWEGFRPNNFFLLPVPAANLRNASKLGRIATHTPEAEILRALATSGTTCWHRSRVARSRGVNAVADDAHLSRKKRIVVGAFG